MKNWFILAILTAGSITDIKPVAVLTFEKNAATRKARDTCKFM